MAFSPNRPNEKIGPVFDLSAQPSNFAHENPYEPESTGDERQDDIEQELAKAVPRSSAGHLSGLLRF